MRQRRPHAVRIGQHLEEASRPTSRARPGRRPRRPRPSRWRCGPARRARRSPSARPAPPRSRASTGIAAGEGGGVGPHLGAALHAGVAADRHEPGAVATDVAAGQAHVHDRPDAVDGITVLGDAHRPDEDRRRRPGVEVDELLDLLGGEAGLLEQSLRGPDPRATATTSAQPVGVGVDERLVDRAASDQPLEHGVGERHVAAGPHRHVQVADLRAEHAPTRATTAPSTTRGRARGTG